MFVKNIVQKYWLSADEQKIHRTDYKGENMKITGLEYPHYELRGVYKVSDPYYKDVTQVLMFDKKTQRYHWYLVA